MRIILILVLLLSVQGKGQTANSLIVRFNSGESLAFAIKERPQISFSGSTLNIATKHFQLKNVRSYQFGDSLTVGINSPKAMQQALVSRNGNILTVSPSKQGQTVKLFTVDGKELPLRTAPDSEGRFKIDLSRWADKVLLLQVGRETIKLKKP
ncbi:MAG: hypothetical protein IJ244_06605 [Bacteroidaceae bacterium]|nr:hypothetical protein [Bacteroidaceae bacterium]